MRKAKKLRREAVHTAAMGQGLVLHAPKRPGVLGGREKTYRGRLADRRAWPLGLWPYLSIAWRP